MSRATSMSFDKTDVHYGSWDGINLLFWLGVSAMRTWQRFEEKAHASVGKE